MYGWGSYGKVGYCFLGDMLKKKQKKNTGLQGSTLSGHHMTTGFGPFELPTRYLLQKGRDHSPPKVCFEEPLVGTAIAVGIHSAMNIHTTKKMGMGSMG